MKNLYENPLKAVTQRLLILLVVVDLVLFFTLRGNSTKFILGSSIGMIVSLFGFYLINLSLKKTLDMEPTKAALYHRRDQFFRNLLYIVVIVIAIKVEYIDPFSLVIGLLGVRIVIQLDSILNFVRVYFKKEV